MSRWQRAPRQFAGALHSAQVAWSPETFLSELQQLWPSVVGPAVAAEATPTAQRAGVLTVSCSASVWAQELDLLGPEIVSRLNERTERGTVVRVRCVTMPQTA